MPANFSQVSESLQLLSAKVKSLGEGLARMGSAVEHLSESMRRIAELSHRFAFALTVMAGLPRYLGHHGMSMLLYTGLGKGGSPGGKSGGWGKSGGFGGAWEAVTRKIDDLQDIVRMSVSRDMPRPGYKKPSRLLSFDTESTGPEGTFGSETYFEKGRITQFTGIHGRLNKEGGYDTTGSTTLLLEDFKNYKEYLTAVHKFLEENPDTVTGSNISKHDIPFLKKQFEMYGLSTSVFDHRGVKDSKKIAQKLFGVGHAGLEELGKRFLGEDFKLLHESLSDAAASMAVIGPILDLYSRRVEAASQAEAEHVEAKKEEKKVDLAAIPGKQAAESTPGVPVADEISELSHDQLYKAKKFLRVLDRPEAAEDRKLNAARGLKKLLGSGYGGSLNPGEMLAQVEQELLNRKVSPLPFNPEKSPLHGFPVKKGRHPIKDTLLGSLFGHGAPGGPEHMLSYLAQAFPELAAHFKGFVPGHLSPGVLAGANPATGNVFGSISGEKQGLLTPGVLAHELKHLEQGPEPGNMTPLQKRIREKEADVWRAYIDYLAGTPKGHILAKLGRLPGKFKDLAGYSALVASWTGIAIAHTVKTGFQKLFSGGGSFLGLLGDLAQIAWSQFKDLAGVAASMLAAPFRKAMDLVKATGPFFSWLGKKGKSFLGGAAAVGSIAWGQFKDLAGTVGSAALAPFKKMGQWISDAWDSDFIQPFRLKGRYWLETAKLWGLKFQEWLGGLGLGSKAQKGLGTAGSTAGGIFGFLGKGLGLFGRALGGTIRFLGKALGGFGLGSWLGGKLAGAGGKIMEHGPAFVSGAARFAATGLLVGSTVASNLLHAGAPDAFETLKGSFSMLAAVIGHALIPFALRLSGWLQDAAEVVHNWSDSLKETVGNVAGWGLVAMAGAVVLNQLVTAAKLLLVPFGLLAKALSWMTGAGPIMGGFLSVVVAASAGLAAWVYSLQKAAQQETEQNNEDAKQRDLERYKKARKLPSDDEIKEEFGDTVGDLKFFGKDPIKYFKGELGTLEEEMQEANKQKLKQQRRLDEFGAMTPAQRFLGGVDIDEERNNFDLISRIFNNKAFKQSKLRRLLELLQAEKEGRAPAGVPEDKQSDETKEKARKLDVSSNAARQLLYTFKGTMTTPRYSSIEDLYKQVQITALGQMPLEAKLLQLMIEGQERMIKELVKQTGMSEQQQKEVIQTFKQLNPGFGN